MAKKALPSPATAASANGAQAEGALAADIIIANAPDPVFVSDLEGKILQANDAVSELLGFRRDEGHVSVTSQEGKGSTFVVDLPLEPLRAAEEPDAARQTA